MQRFGEKARSPAVLGGDDEREVIFHAAPN
jgi:hypothetical protein